MIGNRVRLVLTTTPETTPISITGVLHKLDGAGATVYREGTLPEQQGLVFLPLHRILEIIDLGRAV